eukprot:CAMPEP_0202973462 /NCGR_PEP_ID=MMETSP1396-20130829/50213_1 /ASSEMBLY_ACC=CAM_ASM_000872 /TAXON_ID= /ORGANISM="Pseudokeronopsis sp., Strain Brazil" /LENGTH=128 /DNA_ID=CAMNT_0049705535 /DNA_START=181 /DNA_END=567 /DNA_ORIENTATION=-
MDNKNNITSCSKEPHNESSSLFGKEVTGLGEEIDFYNNSSKIDESDSRLQNIFDCLEMDEEFSQDLRRSSDEIYGSEVDDWMDGVSGSDKMRDPKEMEKILDEKKAKIDEEILTTFFAIKNLLQVKKS